MIVTTTSAIEGKKILEYKRVVFGEVIRGFNFVKDYFLGGRSESYEREIIRSREEALNTMQANAGAAGANAVVGVRTNYEVFGRGNMLMVTVSGTAVVTD